MNQAQADLQKALQQARHATRLLAWSGATSKPTTGDNYFLQEAEAWERVDAIIKGIFDERA